MGDNVTHFNHVYVESRGLPRIKRPSRPPRNHRVVRRLGGGGVVVVDLVVLVSRNRVSLFSSSLPLRESSSLRTFRFVNVMCCVVVVVVVVVVAAAAVCRLSLWLVVSLLCLCDGLYDHTACTCACCSIRTHAWPRLIVPTLTPFHR